MDELTARRAKSFGPVATTYDRVRPGYPPDGVSWLLEEAAAAGIARARRRRVLDLGAGRARSTRDLVARGLDVVAVEPDPHMRAVLEGRVPGADVRAGSAEELPVDDGDVDVVIGAQMWHWVDVERATAEVARVLRPGGTLGLLWNLRDERVEWMAELGSVFGGDDVHHRRAADVSPARGARPSPPPRPVTSVGPRSSPPPTSSTSWPPGARSRSWPTPSVPRCWPGWATSWPATPPWPGRGRIVVPYVTSCWRATRT